MSTRAGVLAREAGRPELATRLVEVEPRLDDRTVRVVVVGAVKQGKSALVYALVGAPVCPVDDVENTAVPTVVSHGNAVSAFVVTEPTPGRFARTPVAPESLRSRLTDAATSGRLSPLRAEVTLPSRVLVDGLTLVDTPGIGGTAAGHAAATLALLPSADAALMLSDATQEMTAPELDFVKQAVSMCSRVTCVVSKTDLQRQWREIVEADQQHLRKAEVDAELMPTSAVLHDLAVQEGDDGLRRRSGVPALATHLTGAVTESVVAERRRVVADEVAAVTHHLTIAIDAELQTLHDPERGGRVVRGLEEAQAAAGALAKRSALWQQTLTDGVVDLLADIDFDLRDRLRAVSREAEQLIDEMDPGEAWPDFGRWLADALARGVADNFVWANQRSEHLAGVVADHFAVEGKVAMPDFTIADTDGILRSIAGLETVDSGRLSLGQKLFIGMKGSYGGILMVGLLTSLAGLALVNPLSVAAGLLLGGYAYRQDAQSRLDRRRNEAKVAVRRLVDDAIFQVTKESRDRLNRVKRLLRDHFTQVADQLKRSLAQAVESARQGAQTPDDERGRRIAELTARRAEIVGLKERADGLVASTATAREGATA